MIQDIDPVMVAAPRGSETAARGFYGDLLGLAEIAKPEPLRSRGGCWFQSGSRQLPIGIEEPFTPARKAHVAFLVSDLDGLMVRLEAAGFACEWDNVLSDVRRFYANDPWGNRLEFVESGEG